MSGHTCMSGMLNGPGVGTGLWRVYTDPLDGLNTGNCRDSFSVLSSFTASLKKNIILSYTKVGIE